MRTIKAALIFSILFASSSSTIASSWNFLYPGNDEARYFFDADTVEKNRDIVTVWIKTVQTTASDNQGSWALAARWRMNCTKRTIQTIASSAYDRDGKFIRSNSAPTTADEVIPDSVGEAILKISCAPNFPRDKSEQFYFQLKDNDVFRATRDYVDFVKSLKDTAPQ